MPEPEERIRVFLLDDHEVVRRGLQDLFESQPDTAQNLPYLGVGYSHLWFNSQLSLNADFGLASQNASAVGHARGLLNGSQSLDDVTRELRWAPVMAVNVSYSF